MCHDCQTSHGPLYTRLLQDGTSVLVCGLCRSKTASGSLKSAPAPLGPRFTKLRPRIFVVT